MKGELEMDIDFNKIGEKINEINPNFKRNVCNGRELTIL